MNQEEQGKKTSQIVTDAAVKKVIPAIQTGELSEQDLEKVAAGATAAHHDIAINSIRNSR